MNNQHFPGDSGDCRRFFLGLDGGGTKTTVLVGDESGNVLFKTVGDTINYCAVGMQQARNNMKAMLDTVAKDAGITHFAGVCIGMSALFGRASEDECAAFCDGIFSADKIIMDSDLYIALAATGEPGAAAVGICGTGSMACGRTTDSRIITKGGYGYLLGDEGSGFRIAQEALFEAVRAAEQSGENTTLLQAALTFWGVKSAPELIDVFYDPPMERNQIAKFAPCVIKEAANGDKIAMQVVQKQASLFADTAKALLKELPQDIPFYVYGGIFEHNKLFRDLFANELPDRTVILLTKTPAEGALRAAINE
ncbi:MAG: hypothetical protein E7523_11455 [Ruminococcaceae bacterium]|nr:hypothetical protein [Oscillospiraceae bacterium]